MYLHYLQEHSIIYTNIISAEFLIKYSHLLNFLCTNDSKVCYNIKVKK